MLKHTRKGTTIVTQQEKVTNETRQQMNNLFQRLGQMENENWTLDWTGLDWTGLGGNFFFRVGARVVLFYDLITQNPRPGHSAKPKL